MNNNTNANNAYTKTELSQIASSLSENGYHITPIRHNEKRPFYKEWSTVHNKVSSHDDIQDFVNNDYTGGFGILCGKVVGIDIDLPDADDAEKVKQLAFEIFGETRLIRVGQAPKCLLLYRTTDEIASTKHGKIDILSIGKQFVAYGVHPTTQERYKWLDLEPINVPLTDIPLITAKQVKEFINVTSHINVTYQSSGGKNSNNLGVVIGKMTDGREKELSNMVFCKVLSHKQDIDTWDDDDVSAIADEIWETFCIRCDLTHPKSNGKPYTVEDVRSKIIYLLQGSRKNKYFKDRNIEGNRHEQFYKPFYTAHLLI